MTELYMLPEVREACEETKEWLRNVPSNNLRDSTLTYFDMSYWSSVRAVEDEEGLITACGTVHCIGGHITHILKKKGYHDLADKFADVTDYTGSRERSLCYPYEVYMDAWDVLTPEQAIKAIDQYLDGDLVDWNGIYYG